MNLRLVLVFASACTTDPIDVGTPAVDESVELAPGPAIGEPCGADGACAEGLSCLTYYGVGGPSGPANETCEIRCNIKTSCPDGLTCVVLSDGPGSVCR